MQFKLKKLTLAFVCCLFLFLEDTRLTHADITSNSEKLLNWAENTFRDLFPNHKSTQNIPPWLFRYYPETDIYTGVNIGDNNAYVLGGPWGLDTPTKIDTVPNLINYMINTGGNSSIPACDTATAPFDMIFTQNGNTVNVNTNGQCIAPSSNRNICKPPRQPTITGNSVLSTSSITSYELKGVSSNTPGIPSSFQAILDSVSNIKSCVINAPANADKLIINTNTCYDLTSEFLAISSNSNISIEPSVSFSFVSTLRSEKVEDCFATEALVITDAHSGEVWMVDAAQATMNLAKKNACLGCHYIDSKLIGPSFTEVAARYSDQADARALLAGRIKYGSVDVWGPIPMPPIRSVNLNDADYRSLAEWILSLK